MNEEKFNVDEQLQQTVDEMEEHVAPNGTSPHVPAVVDQDFHLTDLGNAQRFQVWQGQDMRWCKRWKSFLSWRGSRWERDFTEDIARRAHAAMLRLYTDGRDLADMATHPGLSETDRKAFASEAERLLRHAIRSESRSRIEAMIELCKAGIAIQPEEFDRDGWLLNCPNGTIDLHTGMMRPHRREDFLTKQCEVAFDPEARCETWEAFLEKIFAGRQDLIDYLQRAVGYSLTGDTREECVFLGYGQGANGKSTFLNTIRDLIGDYGHQAAFSTFLVKERDPVRNDIAGLRGSRFVSASEVEEGKRFAEQIIKQMTGRDKMRARFLFENEFEFTPTHKLWFGVNHKPIITGTDLGIWRRIHLIPFTVTIPIEDQDNQLKDRLREEWPGILAWAVRGCMRWQAEGLLPPEIVTASTNEYRREMDRFGQWLEEYCLFEPNGSAKAGDLFLSYQRTSGDKVITQTAFGRKLRDRGLEKGNNSLGYVIWRGIRLVETQKDEPNHGY